MNLHDMTAGTLSSMIKKREISSEQLTKAVIRHAAGYATETFDEAVKTAIDVDKKIAAGEWMHPLAGISAAVNDNICTKDVRTACGSKMLQDFIPVYDAFVVEKMKKAGVPVLGKLNIEEFAMGCSGKEHCGAVFTIGSDTGGEIRRSAAFCGRVGMKPSYGLVSRGGLAAFASSMDQIAAVTKDVYDCAMVLTMISGHDKNDSTSARRPTVDYAVSLDKNIKGMKIGYLSEASFNAIEVYKSLGASAEYCEIPSLKHALAAYYIISSAEASSNLARYDGVKYGHRSQDACGIEELYVKSRNEGFGQEVKKRIAFGTHVLSPEFYDKYYKKAQGLRQAIINEFNAAFCKYDVFLAPTVEEIYTVPANLAGIPALSLPDGVQLMGRAFDEQTVLNAAYALEQEVL